MFKLLKYSYIRDTHLDDPQRVELIKKIVLDKTFLKKVYQTWYALILRELPRGPGMTLEIGSGAGFLKTCIPSLILSDIMHLKGMNLTCEGIRLPVKNQSLKAVVMLNVFHHISSAESFFNEACRCLKPGGRIIMIEPWTSSLGKLLYTRIHHEPCTLNAQTWSFDSSGPLSGANIALPWIVFHRDRKKFESLFPDFFVRRLEPEVNFRYLFSGGLTFRPFLPGWTYSLVEKIESWIPGFLLQQIALFALIVVEKKTLPQCGQ